MSNIEIDQSGKMGDLSTHTVLAFANDIEYAIFIPVRVKRAIIQELRSRGKSKIRAVLQTFAAGLFLLVRGSLGEVGKIVIDIEYTGYDVDIRSMLLNHIWRVDPTFDKEQLIFRRIGKKSPAHKRALATNQGKQGANRRIRELELWAVLGK
jgi:hypothetical protein